MVWGCACCLDIIVGLFLSLFSLCENSHFSTSIYRQWLTTHMVWWCACFLGVILALMFVTFSTLLANFAIVWPQIIWKCCYNRYLVSATPHTILYWSFWNFPHVFPMVWRCLWFGYNPWIDFCHFFHFANFVIFWLQILWKCRDSGYLVSATPHTILYRSLWNFAHVFAMVWRYAWGLDMILELIFATFSSLTLSLSDLRFYESV